MEYSEKYEDISFTNNFAFCKVMQNEEICREVIETLLHINVGRLEYKSFEKDLKLEIDKRGIRLDVYIADSDRGFDLEMQTTGRSETPLANKIRKELRRVQGNEEWRVEYMTLQMFKREAYDFGFTAGENFGFTAGEEQGRNEGIAIGEKRGILLGAKEAKLETAKNLIPLGLSQEQIASVTGLSPEEIENL